MGWLDRLLNRSSEEALPLYQAVVALARQPHWYLAGEVPDTTDGRFDMVAAVLATVLLRLENDSAGAAAAAQVTERFIDDMDAQLRQAGIGDIVVGKRIGKLMAMLGGRMGAYRDGWAAGDTRPALVRNLYREQPPGDAAVAHVADELSRLRESLAATSTEDVAAGRLQ